MLHSHFVKGLYAFVYVYSSLKNILSNKVWSLQKQDSACVLGKIHKITLLFAYKTNTTHLLCVCLPLEVKVEYLCLWCWKQSIQPQSQAINCYNQSPFSTLYFKYCTTEKCVLMSTRHNEETTQQIVNLYKRKQLNKHKLLNVCTKAKK